MLKVEDFELFELPLLSCLVDNQDLISWKLKKWQFLTQFMFKWVDWHTCNIK